MKSDMTSQVLNALIEEMKTDGRGIGNQTRRILPPAGT